MDLLDQQLKMFAWYSWWTWAIKSWFSIQTFVQGPIHLLHHLRSRLTFFSRSSWRTQPSDPLTCSSIFPWPGVPGTQHSSHHLRQFSRSPQHLARAFIFPDKPLFLCPFWSLQWHLSLGPVTQVPGTHQVPHKSSLCPVDLVAALLPLYTFWIFWPGPRHFWTGPTTICKLV